MALRNGQAGKRPEHRAEAAERDAEIIRQRRSGMLLREIADHHGISTTHTARIIKDAMIQARDLMLGEADLYRVEAIDRLTALLNACWDKAIAGSDKHLAEARRIIDSLADYTGARMPLVVEIGESDVDRALRELSQLLDSRSAEAEG